MWAASKELSKCFTKQEDGRVNSTVSKITDEYFIAETTRATYLFLDTFRTELRFEKLEKMKKWKF